MLVCPLIRIWQDVTVRRSKVCTYEALASKQHPRSHIVLSPALCPGKAGKTKYPIMLCRGEQDQGREADCGRKSLLLQEHIRLDKKATRMQGKQAVQKKGQDTNL